MEDGEEVHNNQKPCPREHVAGVGEGCDKSSIENSAWGEAVGKEHTVRESAVEKPAAGCDETLLGEELVGGGALVLL